MSKNKRIIIASIAGIVALILLTALVSISVAAKSSTKQNMLAAPKFRSDTPKEYIIERNNIEDRGAKVNPTVENKDSYDVGVKIVYEWQAPVSGDNDVNSGYQQITNDENNHLTEEPDGSVSLTIKVEKQDGQTTPTTKYRKLVVWATHSGLESEKVELTIKFTIIPNTATTPDDPQVTLPDQAEDVEWV